jgi:DNA-directed RNA polymerase subunit beta
MAHPEVPRSGSRARAGGAARQSFGRINELVPMPNLNNVQRDSFDWFLRDGLEELFAKISPIDGSTGRNTPRTTEV